MNTIVRNLSDNCLNIQDLNYSSSLVSLIGSASQNRCPNGICPETLRSNGCVLCDKNGSMKCITCQLNYILFNGTCVSCLNGEDCPFNNSEEIYCIDTNDLSLCNKEVDVPIECRDHACISQECLYGNFSSTKECDIEGAGCRGCRCMKGWYSNMSYDCYSICGDGNLTSDKECEVGGLGCDDICRCIDGWETQGKMSCKPYCGDKRAMETEECDGGDGCDDKCRCGAGWYPNGNGAVSCYTFCGDGVTVGDEECDGTLGCNDDMCLCVDKHPYNNETGTCSWCGNSIVEIDEECDGGDGCSDNCKCGSGYEYDEDSKTCRMKQENGNNLKVIVICACCGAAVIIVIILVVLVVIMRSRNKETDDDDDGNKGGIEMDEGGLVVVEDGKKVGTLVITKTIYDNPTTIVMMGKIDDKVDVAVKCMKMWGTQLDSEQERDMNVMRKLKSEYVVMFYGTTVVEGRTGLVMEYIPMGSLESLMCKREFSSTLKMRYAKDICLGMCYLHNNKIIHRDLKLSNILVVSDDENSTGAVCKISDFGTSRNVDITTTLSMTHSMTMTSNIGTPLYMAPELLNGTGRYSMSADVYSYGIVLAGLWNQTIPYSDVKFDDVTELLSRISTKGLRPTLHNDCPQSYINLANACWHQDPHQRPTFNDIFKSVFG